MFLCACAQYPRHAPSSVRQLFDPNRWIVVWAGDGAGGKESLGLTKTRTGPDHRTTINFCARSQKCACALDCKDLGHSPGLWPKRYQGNTVTIQRNDQTCVLAASHAAYASLLPYVNEHIQGQEPRKISKRPFLDLAPIIALFSTTPT